MAKERSPIPDEIAAEILFLTDRTCCKCNIRGKGVQIHHIDENPTNHLIDNLAPLCLDCHNETMIKGGFTRQLNASQVKMYRTDWIFRVRTRREKADELASIEAVTGIRQNKIETSIHYKSIEDTDLLVHYLNEILVVSRAQTLIAMLKWDSGITTTMNQGNSDLIDFYEEILVELATFYPKGHFNNQSPETYFNELISIKFNWHRLILEPNGEGTGGRMVSTIIGGSLISELKHMIYDMVSSLSFKYVIDEKIDLIKWREDWLN